jgi:hypothetical protein
VGVGVAAGPPAETRHDALINALWLLVAITHQTKTGTFIERGILSLIAVLEMSFISQDYCPLSVASPLSILNVMHHSDASLK